MAVVYFWYRYLAGSWRDLDAVEYAPDWTAVLWAGLLILVGYAIMGVMWSPICREIAGIRIGAVNAFRISALAWMGRYVPGKIWAVVAKAYLTTGDRSRLASAGVAASVDSVWFALSGLLLALVMLPFAPPADVLPRGTGFVSLALLAAALLGVHPAVFRPVVDAGLRLMRQPLLPTAPRYPVLLAIMLGYVVAFLVVSTGFAVFTGAVSTVRLSDLPSFWVIVPAAWSLGFFVVLAPAGLGVRDSILAFGLDRALDADASVVLVAVIGTRLLTTVVEFACFGLALLLSHPGAARRVRP